MPTNQTEIHQFTHTGDRVMLLKCLGRDGKTYGGFEWPKSGPVDIPGKPDRSTECTAGKVYGWPWGLRIGDGKNPDACADWLVFSAKPENVIAIGDKAGVVVGDDGDRPIVEFVGDMASAMQMLSEARIVWIESRSDGKHANGYRSASSANGYRSASSANGDGSASSANGDWSAALALGGNVTAEVRDKSVAFIFVNRKDEPARWRVYAGAVLMLAWRTKDDGIETATFRAEDMGVDDGETVTFLNGERIDHAK